jgi:hypothetical protein
MKNVIELQLQGDRNYIDIAQISFRALQSLGIDVAHNDLADFSISVLKPLGKKVEIRKSVSSQLNEKCLAQFKFTQNSIESKYDIIEVDSSLPTQMGISEPDFSHHWRQEGDKLFWLAMVDSKWPVFFAFMLMGRLSGIHFFGGTKPKGLSYSMRRIPKPSEISQLWVKKKRGPINGLCVIELHCGTEFIGLSKLKI